MNTPQALRQRNKMPKQQQPVPPRFCPEAIADGILWAADKAPREVLLGVPTFRAVWGQRLIPGLLDRYVARVAWDSQFVDRPNDQAGDILFDTLPGDPGAHGPYREGERGADLLMRLRRHPRGVLTAAVAVGACALAAVTSHARGVENRGWGRVSPVLGIWFKWGASPTGRRCAGGG